MLYLILKKGEGVLTSSVYSLFIVKIYVKISDGYLAVVSPHSLQCTEFSGCPYLIYHQGLWALLQPFYTQPRPFSSHCGPSLHLLQHALFSTVCELLGIIVELSKSFSSMVACIYPQTNEAQR